MVKNLDFLVKHFDPFRDFEDFTFVNIYAKDGLKHAYKNFKPFLYFPKHIIRGAYMGGAMGCLAALLSDKDMAASSQVGLVIGMSIDTKQYLLRYVYNYLNVHLSNKKTSKDGK